MGLRCEHCALRCLLVGSQTEKQGVNNRHRCVRHVLITRLSGPDAGHEQRTVPQRERPLKQSPRDEGRKGPPSPPARLKGCALASLPPFWRGARWIRRSRIRLRYEAQRASAQYALRQPNTNERLQQTYRHGRESWMCLRKVSPKPPRTCVYYSRGRLARFIRSWPKEFSCSCQPDGLPYSYHDAMCSARQLAILSRVPNPPIHASQALAPIRPWNMQVPVSGGANEGTWLPKPDTRFHCTSLTGALKSNSPKASATALDLRRVIEALLLLQFACMRGRSARSPLTSADGRSVPREGQRPLHGFTPDRVAHTCEGQVNPQRPPTDRIGPVATRYRGQPHASRKRKRIAKRARA